MTRFRPCRREEEKNKRQGAVSEPRPRGSSGHLRVFWNPAAEACLLTEKRAAGSVLFNERNKQTVRHNSEVLLFGGEKGRELVKEQVRPPPNMKRKRRGEGAEGETPGCSSGIVQPSASEGHLSLAGRFTQVPRLPARFVGLERRLLSAGRRWGGARPGEGIGRRSWRRKSNRGGRRKKGGRQREMNSPWKHPGGGFV